MNLWVTCADNKDVCEILVEDGFHKDIITPILQCHSENLRLVAVAIALIRRVLSKQETRDKMAQLYLFTLATIVKVGSKESDD